jgi:hypothetical protein
MNSKKGSLRFFILLLLSLAVSAFSCCDSGKKTVDQVTGHDAVKQFEKSKEKIDDVVDEQSERLNALQENDSDKEMNDEFSEEDE